MTLLATSDERHRVPGMIVCPWTLVGAWVSREYCEHLWLEESECPKIKECKAYLGETSEKK